MLQAYVKVLQSPYRVGKSQERRAQAQMVLIKECDKPKCLETPQTLGDAFANDLMNNSFVVETSASWLECLRELPIPDEPAQASEHLLACDDSAGLNSGRIEILKRQRLADQHFPGAELAPRQLLTGRQQIEIPIALHH